MVPPPEPLATSELTAGAEAGGSRRLLDDMLAERSRPPLPPPPVLTVEPVPVDAAPVNGRRGARRRLAEVEALARRNLRAAEEARRLVDEERHMLEEEASARTEAERTAAALRRELDRLRTTEEQRAAQARFSAAREARAELESEIDRVHDEHARVVDELDRLRGTLFDHDSLLDEYSRRVREEQTAQAKARADQVRAEEAQRVAERNLEIATETGRRRAEDDLARFNKVELAWREACVERDRVTAELRALTTGDGEIARLRNELEGAREDTARLMSDLDVQSARGDTAEKELATARDACARAEKLAAEATEARDLSGIALETTRSELAEKTEALDAERSTNQARVADLVAQLGTATRTAESATERSADLEARLDQATAARDEALAQAEALADQLSHAQSDADLLRTQAASIGDELAATQSSLESARREGENVRQELHRSREQTESARRDAWTAQQALASMPAAPVDPSLVPAPESVGADAPVAAVAAVTAVTASAADASDGSPLEALADAASEVASGVAAGDAQGDVGSEPPVSFEDAIASAFRIEPEPAPAPAPVARSTARPKTTFRTVEPEGGRRRKRNGGPEVEREAALVREVPLPEPVPVPVPVPAAAVEAPEAPVVEAPVVEEVGEQAPEPPKRAEQPWRRTAMAELTALATDSDDLTPRRRR